MGTHFVFSIRLVLVLVLSLFAVAPFSVAQTSLQNPERDVFARVSRSKNLPTESKSEAKSRSRATPKTISGDFSEALDIIQQNYVGADKLNYNNITKSAITGALRSLDPHSNYFDAEEYRELQAEQNSEYSGIGAAIANFTIDGETDTYITAPFPNSPAYRNGLRFGDKVLEVNGVEVRGQVSSEVRDRIRGDKNTIVRLTLERAATKKIETIELRRNSVGSPSIPDAYILQNNVGYIALTGGFNYTTIDELRFVLGNLHEQGMTSLIFDLRDNPGGILDQAVRVASEFLPAGQVVLSQKGRLSYSSRIWKASNDDAERLPITVLVNGNTASASEIVAGALQDHDRAVIVGETTFGKGLVQSIIELPSGSGLTLTTARYFTPSGRSIQRDYSKGNIYDYFTKSTFNSDKAQTKGALAKTDTGRFVYGGGGIQPDDVVKAEKTTDAQRQLLNPIFAFSRELVNGRISGFEQFRNQKPVKYGMRVEPDEFFVTTPLFNAFKNFVAKDANRRSLVREIEMNHQFVEIRLRFNITMANYGSVTAQQILIEKDPQVSRALQTLPKARQMANSMRKTLQQTFR